MLAERHLRQLMSLLVERHELPRPVDQVDELDVVPPRADGDPGTVAAQSDRAARRDLEGARKRPRQQLQGPAQDLGRVRGRVVPQRFGAQERRVQQTGAGVVEAGARLRGELASHRPLPLALLLLPLVERHQGESHGHHQAGGDGGELQTLAPRRRRPTRQEVLHVQRGRRRPVIGARGEPGLHLAEVPAAQEVASFLSTLLPLHRTLGEPRVGLEPAEVGVEGLDQLVDGLVEVVVAKEDPVQLAQRFVDRRGSDVTPDDGYQALAVLTGVEQLAATLVGPHEVRAEDEDAGVGPFDRLRQAVAPGLAGTDLVVNPDLALAITKRLLQSLDEGPVLARVGDEQVGGHRPHFYQKSWEPVR